MGAKGLGSAANHDSGAVRSVSISGGAAKMVERRHLSKGNVCKSCLLRKFYKNGEVEAALPQNAACGGYNPGTAAGSVEESSLRAAVSCIFKLVHGP